MPLAEMKILIRRCNDGKNMAVRLSTVAHKSLFSVLENLRSSMKDECMVMAIVGRRRRKRGGNAALQAE